MRYNFDLKAPMTNFSRIFIVISGLVALAASSFAQPAPPEFRSGIQNTTGYSTLNMTTKLGSFKLINGEGRVSFSFTGTVMVNVSAGSSVAVAGNLRKELERKDRVVYHGVGTITISGKWRAVQWFGRDLTKFMWFGKGVARVSGEFDKDLNTGFYWFDDPNDKNYWFAGSATNIALPRITDLAPKPKERKE